MSLCVRAATKRFGALVAVSEASLEIETCKIHAIVGENGAGKSTLSSIAAGLVVPDEGRVEIDGAVLTPHTAREAIARGVGLVQQHFRLIDALTVLENAMLGVEPTRAGRIDRERVHEKFAKVQREIGSSLDPDARVSSLGVGDRQRLEIARVLFRDARIVLLDEPTAVLSPGESAALYATLRRLADAGRAIAVVTHKLDEVLDHADQVTVMRRGRVVSTSSYARGLAANRDRETRRRALLRDAFHDDGDVAENARSAVDASSKALLEIDDARSERMQGVTLRVLAHEIVGVAGVEGNGQRDLVDALAGLSALTHERRRGHDETIRTSAPLEVVHDDRHRRGLVLDASVADNALLGELERFTRASRLLDAGAMRDEASRRVKDGAVQPAEIDLPAAALSGGNQQKLVVARALARDASRARVLVAAQPTRGVDIAAARQIHARIVDAAKNGAAVLVVSADLDELRALSHRIVVMRRGRIVFEAARDAQGAWTGDATNEKLGAHMVDGSTKRDVAIVVEPAEVRS